MKTLYLFIALVLGIQIPSIAQSSIQGRIFDKEKEAIVGATVLMYAIEDSALIAYAVSNTEGKYILNTKQEYKVRIVVKTLSHKTEERVLEAPFSTEDFYLSFEETVLDDVLVKGQAISEEGDTLIYQAKTFSQAKDETVEDLLQNMPGIEVDANGGISYQGRRINKLYINGKDLLESKYMLATQNLPDKVVTSIEVYKNHQPIKMLKDVVHSIDPAININLKDEVVISGMGEVGGGHPELWHAKAAPMLFSKKQQFISELIASNNGKDYTQKFNAINLFEALEWGVFFEDTPQQLLGWRFMPSPVFDIEDINQNRTYSVSSNYLTSLKSADLKISIDAYSQEQEQFIETNHQYFLGTDTLNINESKNSSFNQKYLNATFIYEKNEEKSYVKNQLRFKYRKAYEKSDIENNGNFSQWSNHQYFDIRNRHSRLVKVNNKYYNLLASIHYTNEPQFLNFNGGPIFSEIAPYKEIVHQDLDYQHLKSFVGSDLKNKISSSTTLELRFGLEYAEKKLTSNVKDLEEGINILSFENALQYREFKPFIKPSIQYRKNKFYTSVSADFNYLYAKLNEREFTSKLNTLLINPKLFSEYKVKRLTLRLGSGYSPFYNGLPSIYQSYIIKDYRSLSKQNTPLLLTFRWDSNIELNYELPEYALFIYGKYFLSKNWKDWISSMIVDDNGGVIADIQTFNNNIGMSEQWHIGLDKFFIDLNTKIKVQANLTQTNENIVLQDQIISSTILSNSYKIEANVMLNKRIAFKPYWNYSTQNTTNEGESLFNVEQQIYGLDLSFNYKNHLLLLENRYYQHDFMNEEILFSDFIYRLNLKNKKVNLELRVNNIFDQTHYTNVSTSPSLSSVTYFNLRPRMIFGAVKFQF